HLHMKAQNMTRQDTQSLHSGSKVWPEDATHTLRIPPWATRFQATATWGTVLRAGTAEVRGLVRIFMVHPDGSELSTQETRWEKDDTSGTTFNIVLGDNKPIPAKFRGQNVRLELRGTKLS